ncbi:MAG: phenylacetic acid degradation operon negative regulatory protein PaaX [Hyphomicrobiales bacterium]|nr:phenylacetic acid degradation operon negative regulatory protein PaaX [Hyphomicrobiales bacterium]
MIAPHGGTVWLGGFIRLVEPLGLNPRMVRTAVFRLSREKWLVSEQIGRRSFYSLTPTGKRRFEAAFQRIYEDARAPWNGEWRIVILPADGPSPPAREALRKELLWQGFGVIAPGVFAHPSGDTESLVELLQNAGAHDKAVVLKAETLGALSARPLKALVDECWSLDRIAGEYQAFVELFRPVARILRSASAPEPEQCFVVRTLLMHEFRRVQLRDPQLPQSLLPQDWPGDVARALCRDIYRLCWGGVESHLMKMLETADGPLPRAAGSYQWRFGGVGAPAAEDAA